MKYGVTTDYVLGMQVVLADGTAVRLGGPRLKDVAGLSLTKLFVGSEGTLGVDHRGDAAAAARPATASAPSSPSSPSIEAAADAVARDHRDGFGPSHARAHGPHLRSTPSRTHAAMGLDRTAAAMLVAAFRCTRRARLAHENAAVMARRLRSTRRDRSVLDRRCRTRARRSRPRDGPLSRPSEAARIAAAGGRRGAVYRRCRPGPGIERIGGERDVTTSVVAHAGDGNTHPLVVYDPADAARPSARTWPSARVMDLAVELGGTITGEHGVGRLKKAGGLSGDLGPEGDGVEPAHQGGGWTRWGF